MNRKDLETVVRIADYSYFEELALRFLLQGSTYERIFSVILADQRLDYSKWRIASRIHQMVVRSDPDRAIAWLNVTSDFIFAGSKKMSAGLVMGVLDGLLQSAIWLDGKVPTKGSKPFTDRVISILAKITCDPGRFTVSQDDLDTHSFQEQFFKTAHTFCLSRGNRAVRLQQFEEFVDYVIGNGQEEEFNCLSRLIIRSCAHALLPDGGSAMDLVDELRDHISEFKQGVDVAKEVASSSSFPPGI